MPTYSNMRFESYASKHAVLIDTAGTYTFSNCFFDQSGTNDIETTHATGTVTINITNGGTVPTVTKTGAGDYVINNDVTTLVNVKDDTGANEQDARVYLKAKNGTGPLPYQDSVTITRSGSTATVSHTAHGLKVGDKVLISGANQVEYNGVNTVTAVTTNSYDYTVSGSPTTPATGTITATWVALQGLTDASGNISADRTLSANQPVDGWVRKGSSSPYFDQSPLDGTIDKDNGATFSVQLLLDE